MANQPEVIQYDAGVYQIEANDPVDGGVGAVTNQPLLNLANRTAWLKKHVDDIESGSFKMDWAAPKNSPTFTGTPAAPTPALGDNTTKIATTAFVQGTVNGKLSKSIAGGGTITLTAVEAGNGILEFTGALTSNRSMVVPAASGRWIVLNKTTGNYTVTVKTAAGSGVVCGQGLNTEVVCDGTNVMYAKTDFPSPALTGTPTAPTAAPGTNTDQIATMAALLQATSGFGVGADSSPGWPYSDLDAAPTPAPGTGFYRFTGSFTNVPPAAGAGIIIWTKYASTSGYMLVVSGGSAFVYGRYWNGTAWGAWNRVDARGHGFGLTASESQTYVSDLNDLSLTSGQYRYGAASANLPSWAGAAGSLEVVQQQSGYRTQIITENSTSSGSAGRRGWRVLKNGTWQPWQEIMSESATMQYAGSITGVGANLNDYLMRGIYVVPSTTIAQDGVNFPIASSGSLEVLGAYNQGNQGSMTTNVSQRFTSANQNRVFSRTLSSGNWTAWKELAVTDSPSFTGTPTAPTAPVGTSSTQIATMAALLNGMGAFGLGVDAGTSHSATADSITASGTYLVSGTNSVASGLPVNVTHVVTHNSGTTATSGFQLAAPLTASASNKGRFFARAKAGDVWSAWQEFAYLDSPTFTGTPVAPTASAGTASGQIATTSFADSIHNGRATVAVSTSNQTLTAVQAGVGIIEITGALTSNWTGTLPSKSGQWIFNNKTTGNFSATIKTAAGAGVVLPRGEAVVVYCDGTDCSFAGRPVSVAENASETEAGIIRIATQAQANALADDSAAITAKKLGVVLGTQLVSATESVAGTIRLATVAQSQAMTDDTRALTPKKLADAFKGGNQSFNASGGFQKLPGGMILQCGTFGPVSAGATTNITFPVAFPNACLFAAGSRGEDGGMDPDGYSINSRSKTGMAIRYQDSGSDGSTVNLWFALGY